MTNTNARDAASQGEVITTTKEDWNDRLPQLTVGTFRLLGELKPGYTIAQPHVSDQGDDYVDWQWSTLESVELLADDDGIYEAGTLVATYSAGPTHSEGLGSPGEDGFIGTHRFFSRSPEEQELAREAQR